MKSVRAGLITQREIVISFRNFSYVLRELRVN